LCSEVTQLAQAVRALVSIATPKKMTAPLQHELMESALLAKLMDEDRQRLVPPMMRTDLRAQAVLQRAGEDVVHTWFPCGCATAAFRVWMTRPTQRWRSRLWEAKAQWEASSRMETFPLSRRATSRQAGALYGSRPLLLNSASSIRCHCATGFRVIRTVCSLKYSRLQRVTRPIRSCSVPQSGCWRGSGPPLGPPTLCLQMERSTAPHPRSCNPAELQTRFFGPIF
jgi:hypothetical protein